MIEETANVDLVPARMLNEVVFCPRLAFIEWMEGEFRDNAFTAEGRHAHRRVDHAGGGREISATEALDPAQRIHARSVMLSAVRAGIVARIDLLEAEGCQATPVDYKRGSPPDVPERCYEPERVQLCAQALVLEENGFSCSEGVLYFAGARQRITVSLDATLRARTLAAVEELRTLVRTATLPPVLEGSPKCFGCSLAGVCLPDEIGLLGGRAQEPRRLFPARDDALPLYVQAQGGRIGLHGETLRIIAKDSKPCETRLRDVSLVAIFGNVQISTQAIRALCAQEIPLCYFSMGGWFYGMLRPLGGVGALLRQRQHAAATLPETCLAIAQSLIEQKIRNQRTLLRRNLADPPAQALGLLRHLARKARAARSAEELLGLEGTAARVYFSSFGGMLCGELGFEVKGRNRRPPRDPVNALLSLAYALLAKDITIALAGVGFDVGRGFLHQHRPGRPALALDLMEPFRPLIADSVVLTAINTGIIQKRDFIQRVGAVSLSDPGRRRFIEAYTRRLDELVTHPVFKYRLSYRRVFEVQARLLGRYLAGEVNTPPFFVTR